MSRFNWEGFLDVAERLLEGTSEADWRSSISRASHPNDSVKEVGGYLQSLKGDRTKADYHELPNRTKKEAEIARNSSIGVKDLIRTLPDLPYDPTASSATLNMSPPDPPPMNPWNR